MYSLLSYFCFYSNLESNEDENIFMSLPKYPGPSVLSLPGPLDESALILLIFLVMNR